MSDTVDFDKKSVKEYLDECIEYWRSYRDEQASESQLLHLNQNKDLDGA